MSLNPKTANVPSVTTVKVGRKASAASINDTLTSLAHVENRRMGIYSCQPPLATFDGDNEWETGNLSGSYYKTHGWAYSGSYEDVTGQMNARWCSTYPDLGAKDTTIQMRVDVRFNGSVALAAPVSAPCQLTQSYCDNTTTAIGTSLTQDTSGSFRIKPWANAVNRVFYDPMTYASLYNDAGSLQFTTRDLKSVELWLQDEEPLTTVFFSAPSDPTETEANRAFEAGDIKLTPGSTVGLYDNALVYIPQFTAYPRSRG
jgi:hypothetical protein